jgi:hypothetical protein
MHKKSSMTRSTPQPARAGSAAFAPDRPEINTLTRLLGKPNLTLADYHAVGSQLRRLAEDSEVAGRRGWRQQLAATLGVSESTLNKALQFCRSYEKNDLPGLEQLGVGWSQLSTALAVKSKRKRSQLLRRAKEEHWGLRELQREVQRLRGRRRRGGRTRKPPESRGLVADVSELHRVTELWNDFHAKVWSAPHRSYAAELACLNAEGRKAVREELDRAKEQLKARGGTPGRRGKTSKRSLGTGPRRIGLKAPPAGPH